MFTPLKELILRNATRFSHVQSVMLASISEVWPRVLKEFLLSENVRPLEYRKGVLTLSCDSLAEAASLRLHKAELKTKINALLARPCVDEIRFRAR
jgi:predicted nucleic acid-binding Zn ribbon protein